jgi:Ca-activated chloride channel homolog
MCAVQMLEFAIINSLKREQERTMLTEPSVLTLSVTPRHAVVGLDSTITSTQVCATLKACELDDTKRAPVDIVVALDVSGSMDGAKLHLCKMTLDLLLRQLTPQDRFGLVSFSDDAVIEIPVRKLTEANKRLAAQTIKQLCTRGCTNLSAAVGLSAQEIVSVETPNEVRSILFLTDGLANQGITSPEGIVELTKSCLSTTTNQAPIAMHCFGYGSGHNECLLRDMTASSEGGSYYFVENDEQVSSAFGDALGGILSIVAQSAVLTISVPIQAKGVTILDVHHKNKVKTDNGWKITIGDFYSEESRDILFSVKLASQNLGEIPHVNVVASYTDTIQKTLVQSDTCGCVIARPTGTEVSTPNPYVEVQWLRVYATEGMEEAERLSKIGNLSAARDNIMRSMDFVSSNENLAADPLIKQIAFDLEQVHLGLETEEAYESFGRMNLITKAQTHVMQRCSEISEESNFENNTYRSSRKSNMRKKFNESK